MMNATTCATIREICALRPDYQTTGDIIVHEALWHFMPDGVSLMRMASLYDKIEGH